MYVDVNPYTLAVKPKPQPLQLEAAAAADEGEQQEQEQEEEQAAQPPLYAWGPLRGDNFVRFLVGEGWPLVQQLSGLGAFSAR